MAILSAYMTALSILIIVVFVPVVIVGMMNDREAKRKAERYSIVPLDYGYHIFDRDLCREIPRRFATKLDADHYIATH